MKLRHTLLVALSLLGALAPGADAATTVGFQIGTGVAAGEAITVKGDGRANDIAITLSTARFDGAVRTSFRITDRRARVRVVGLARREGCRARGRHTVVCPRSVTRLAFVTLGAGNDRLTVTDRSARSVHAPGVPAPDGLAGIPTVDGGDGAFEGWSIEAGPGDDRIGGSPYFDRIAGGPGSDVLDGRAGSDVFEQRGERGTDTILGGRGHDVLAWRSPAPLHVDLRSGRFDGGTVRSVDKVQGGAGDDVLVGSDGEELLQGSGGADTITGLGGADLLVGDGVSALPSGADTIDGGDGNDLVDVSNSEFNAYGASFYRAPPGPADRLICGAGTDRIDATPGQPVPADCEGARFQDAATTVPLRPAAGPGGTLVYDVPCPARSRFGHPVGVCDGTLTLTRSADAAVLGSAPFSIKGGARAPVAVKPVASVAGIGPVGVQISGGIDKPRPDDAVNRFDFGWALALF